MTGPRQLGAYRVERLLGAGSFATVWLGYDPALDAHVAIKVLADNWSHDLRVRERFEQEARMLWRLADDRVVRVHAVGVLPDGRPYSVMDFAEGGSLRDRLARGDLPPGEALRVLREIAEGVAVLHRHRIVHRDLTPGNILFRGDRVLIADLGLAKALAAASGLTARAGTPGYMAPEQESPSAVVDTTADVYALGQLGRRLRVPARLAPVLRRATARDPGRRYRDAAAFGAAIDQVVRTRAAPGPIRRAGCLAAAGAVLVAVPSAGVLPEGPRTAADRTGQVTVTLPEGWRGLGSGWAGRFDAEGRPAPALVVSPDPEAWPTDPAMPGAFVGLTRGMAAVTAPDFVAGRPHARCTPSPPRRSRQGGIDWVVARFTCATGKHVIIEAAGPAAGTLVYVQLAPPAGAADRDVDAFLAGVRVTGSRR
ncbi:serine/threonine-protein kinase [Paractinoplanes atraurantiacus]|uniref:non-specific serine/threonine protein kinase n=1 Tax=Paractinoplanes atraurantiacus TaxID=1036182 RepID=A0A285JYL1_9ACTN|nr:serine/threonine-protein kinase [Actinoplanes atraurantiacus]SNY64376.1 Protein kinase domain-containing protein [Actinoplanes atraurantiacus]